MSLPFIYQPNYTPLQFPTRKKQSNSVPLDQIKSSLETAFDEGAESPYSLKDQIVERLYNSLARSSAEPQLIKKVNADLTAKLICKTIPTIIQTMLVNTRLALCGGSILKHMISPNFGWKSSDYDIFGYYKDIETIKLNEKTEKKRVNPYGSLGAAQHISYTKKITTKTPTGECIINLIALDKKMPPDLIIEKFDLQMCQIALIINDNGSKLIASPQTFDDIVARRINLSTYQKGRPFDNPNICDRIKKYIKRGFHDQTKLVQKEAISYLI